MVATTNHGVVRQVLAQILGVTAIAAVLAGCQQPVATDARGQPEVAVTTADPVMLSGAAFAPGRAPVTDTVTTGSIPPAGGLANAPAVEAMPAPQETPSHSSVAATTPMPQPAQPVNSASATPAPEAQALRADGYPNINAAPQEPGGKLLTPEERAKLIAELNALAGRGGAQ